MPIVATVSSAATHSCSFEYLSPGGASIFSSKKLEGPARLSSRAQQTLKDFSVHQARPFGRCQAQAGEDFSLIVMMIVSRWRPELNPSARTIGDEPGCLVPPL